MKQVPQGSSESGVSVRSFVELDRQALRQLYLESRQHTFDWVDPQSLHLSDFDRDTRGERIWIAERDGSVVGFASVYEQENFIHNLFVAPDWIGFGCGSELLRASLEGIGRPARLKCVAENSRALLFYQAKGWRKVDEGMSDDGLYYVMETY